MRKVLQAFEVIDNEIEKNKQLYADYINTHVANVQKGYRVLILPLVKKDVNLKYFSKEELVDAISKLDKHISLHDASKWSKEEFDSYRYKFYPTQVEKSDPGYTENCEMVFGYGWKHHHENNDHHANHWCEDGIKRDMPLDCILEMICDWYSMSVYFNSSMIDWWNNKAQKERSLMTQNTIEIVDDLLNNVLQEKLKQEGYW